jgi:hypothetical protein
MFPGNLGSGINGTKQVIAHRAPTCGMQSGFQEFQVTESVKGLNIQELAPKVKSSQIIRPILKITGGS